jgi:hypothetical protein
LQDVNPVAILQQQSESASYLLFNASLTNNVYVSTDNNVGPGGGNVYTIGSLGSIAITSANQWWACTDPGATTELDVLPGGTQQSPAPSQIAEVIAPLAAAIAQQIFNTGIQTLAAPTPMYNVSGSGGGSGATLIGGTIPAQAFQQTGCYDSGKTQVFCDNQFTGFVGRSAANGHLSVTKKFWNLSEWTLTKNDLANYASFGTTVIFALKPVAPPFGAITNAEKTNLTNFLNGLTGLGFTPSTAIIILWQEANNGNNFTAAGQAQYGAMMAAYGPIVNASGFPLVVSVGASAGITSGNNFLTAALGAAGVTLQGFYTDLYFGAWNGGYDMGAAFALADTHGLPCGLSEFGCHISDNFTAYFTQASGPPGLTVGMQSRQQANKVNLPSAWYQGQCSATGVGDLTQPILTATDPRIPFYQTFFDTLTTGSGGTAFTIPATSTVTLAPVNPSPIGGLAPADFMSYELALEISAGAASTNPFIALTLLWFDFDQVPRNQDPVYKEVWHIPMGANGDPNGPLFVSGGGRQHGGFLQIKINNQDTVACSITNFSFFGTARPGARSALTWNPNTNVSPVVPMPGITGNAQSADQSLQIGREYGVTIPAGQSKSYINGLWAGQAMFRAHATGAAGNNVAFELQPLPAGVFGAATDIFHQLIGAAGNIEIPPTEIALPRCATLMVITNNDASPVTVEYLLIGVETS